MSDTQHGESEQIRQALSTLSSSLKSALQVLNGSSRPELIKQLHNPDVLPEKELYELSNSTIDLLHETKQLLEPKTLILAEHFMWYANCKCLNTAVELGVVEALKATPRDIEDLAQHCQARPDRLKQIMRVLCADGIFDHDMSTGLYTLNECSTLLLKDHWTGWWSWVDLYGNEFYDMARGIPASCRAGETRMASQIQFNTDLSMFSWFAQQGALSRVHRTLGGGAIAQAPGIATDYPWAEIVDTQKPLIDIGGGGGGLITALMGKYPGLRAGIFDRPEVIEQAKKNFYDADGSYHRFGPRVDQQNLHAGDFFQSIPPYEMYCMKFCLHDWNDDDCVRILKNIRQAIIPGEQSRFVLLEILLRRGRSGQLSRMADMSVMMAAAGYERELWEWQDLANKSGWEIRRIFDLRAAWPHAMELVPI